MLAETTVTGGVVILGVRPPSFEDHPTPPTHPSEVETRAGRSDKNASMMLGVERGGVKCMMICNGGALMAITGVYQ